VISYSQLLDYYFFENFLHFPHRKILWYVLGDLSGRLCCCCYHDKQVTRQHNDDCKKLLRLMGVPVVEVNSVSLVSCYIATIR
jgi:hypothetical protein